MNLQTSGEDGKKSQFWVLSDPLCYHFRDSAHQQVDISPDEDGFLLLPCRVRRVLRDGESAERVAGVVKVPRLARLVHQAAARVLHAQRREGVSQYYGLSIGSSIQVRPRATLHSGAHYFLTNTLSSLFISLLLCIRTEGPITGLG